MHQTSNKDALKAIYCAYKEGVNISNYKITTDQLRQLVTEKYSLVKTLRRYSGSNSYHVGQTCYCPFHDNTNTPAATIFDDDNGERLFCFSEKKQYTSADALEKLMHYDVYELGQKLWNSMSPLEKSDWLAEHNVVDYNSVFVSKEKPVTKQLEVKINQFKSNKITISDLLNEYIK